MTTFQRVIKYLALGLAVLIIVIIFSGIFFTVKLVGNVFDSNSKNIEELKSVDLDYSENILNLDIDLHYSKLSLKNSNEFKLETNSKNIQTSIRNNTLKIEEKNHKFNINKESNEVIVYIPSNIVLQQVDIDTGAGEVKISSINSHEFDFEIGAGKATISNLNILNEADISTGTGKVVIESGSINNLSLEVGVGETMINSKLTGNSKVEVGIGNIELNLTDGLDNYTIYSEKGIGSINIGNNNVSNNSRIGNGPNRITIEGGIGKISVN